MGQESDDFFFHRGIWRVIVVESIENDEFFWFVRGNVEPESISVGNDSVDRVVELEDWYVEFREFFGGGETVFHE